MILHGDCLDKLKELADNSIDSIVTDPPYGLSFMGKKWDYDVPSIEIWKECLRVLKPGGHLLSFGGTRTYHRLAINIEDAGFEIRDQIQWLYGSGFPKSHNIKDGDFKGWGTALKPANEPICLARKPLEKGLTVSENVLKYGCGALNIDASRIGESLQGRWPANIILDEAAAEMLDEQSGLNCGAAAPVKKKVTPETTNLDNYKKHSSVGDDGKSFKGDSGGASRFFYVAKASKRERNAGLDGMPTKNSPKFDGGDFQSASTSAKERYNQNHHPTVKPVKLMEYLIKLITPPNGTVLDPFLGSGTTGVAAKSLGYKVIGIEREIEYVEIATKRMEAV